MKEERRKRDAAHELASAGWLNSIRENRVRKVLLPDGTIGEEKTKPDYVPASRVADLGARVRAERDAKPIKRTTMDRKRKAKMKALKERLNAAYNAQRRGPYQWPKDESRYFPHQGKRECARRIRQDQKRVSFTAGGTFSGRFPVSVTPSRTRS